MLWAHVMGACYGCMLWPHAMEGTAMGGAAIGVAAMGGAATGDAAVGGAAMKNTSIDACCGRMLRL